MSAETASSTEPGTLYVRIVNEAVDVWRPVQAYQVGESVYRISEQAEPEDEQWAFRPGETVVVERRPPWAGQGELVAVARATDFDEPSRLPIRLAG